MKEGCKRSLQKLERRRNIDTRYSGGKRDFKVFENWKIFCQYRKTLRTQLLRLTNFDAHSETCIINIQRAGYYWQYSERNEESWNLLYLLFFLVSSILLLLLTSSFFFFLEWNEKLCRLCRGFIPALRNDPITVTHISFPPSVRPPLSREFDCFPRHSSSRYSIHPSVRANNSREENSSALSNL